MLCRVALVRTDVSEELSASFIGVKRIGELGTTLAVTSTTTWYFFAAGRLLVTASVGPSSPSPLTPIKEVRSSSETSVLTRVTRRNIPKDTIWPQWNFQKLYINHFNTFLSSDTTASLKNHKSSSTVAESKVSKPLTSKSSCDHDPHQNLQTSRPIPVRFMLIRIIISGSIIQSFTPQKKPSSQQKPKGLITSQPHNPFNYCSH
jgi:hypothetical protein